MQPVYQQTVMNTKSPLDVDGMACVPLRHTVPQRLSHWCVVRLLAIVGLMLALMGFMYIVTVRSIPIEQNYQYGSSGASAHDRNWPDLQ